MDAVIANFKKYGLAYGIGSTEGDGLDPKASKAAVKRREAVLQ
jgi:hypothetical protein